MGMGVHQPPAPASSLPMGHTLPLLISGAERWFQHRDLWHTSVWLRGNCVCYHHHLGFSLESSLPGSLVSPGPLTDPVLLILTLEEIPYPTLAVQISRPTLISWHTAWHTQTPAAASADAATAHLPNVHDTPDLPAQVQVPS